MTGSVAPDGADTALRVLSRVEELPAESTGALVFGSDPKVAGMLLLEHGRVCWAAAPALRRRLSDLLRECASPPMDNAEAENLFQACKLRQRPLGELLVSEGRVTPQALRLALLHHTAESLLMVQPWASEPHWVSHRARGYQSAFTFLPVELLCHANAVARGEVKAQLLAGLLVEVAGTRVAAVFDRPGEVLIACQLPEGFAQLRELRAAGAWAAQSLADGPARSEALKFAFDGHGGTWVGWRNDGLTWLVRCTGRDDFSALMRRLHGHGFTAAVHSSVPIPSAAS
ncbi:MAG: hypothetical protein QM723_37450 [Myxococcaceae bacterium]